MCGQPLIRDTGGQDYLILKLVVPRISKRALCTSNAITIWRCAVNAVIVNGGRPCGVFANGFISLLYIRGWAVLRTSIPFRVQTSSTPDWQQSYVRISVYA